MSLDDIAVNYYYDSLNLAQKALLAGLTISGIAFLLTISGEAQPPYIIPFIGTEVRSLSFFSASLLALHFACGMLCCFGINKAIDNFKLISNKEMKIRLLQAPNILLAGEFTRVFLYAIFFFVGASLASQLLDIHGWKTSIAGSVLASPYFIALRYALDLKKQ